MVSARLIGIRRHRLQTDGDGVTTLVAFNGCPLRCRFCLNKACWEPDQGNEYTPETLFEEVKIDQLYFLATHGGITFGGGEPLLQKDFIKEFRALCGPQWQIVVETSLHVPFETVQEMDAVLDGYIVDVKDMNPEIYKAYSGISNEHVIDNLRWIASEHPELLSTITLRLPHIPNYNTDDDRNKSQAFLETLGYTNFDRFEYRIR